MNPIAVQFGAGKIGRGFFGDLLNQAGFEVVFVEVRQDLVESLNRHSAYTIQWVDGTTHTVSPVRALHIEEKEAVAQAVAEAQVVCTAVGVNALPGIALPLAKGLLRRFGKEGGRGGEKEDLDSREQAAGSRKPKTKNELNLLIGENDVNAHQTLQEAVKQHLPADPLGVLEQVGFVRCVINRMVFEELTGDPPIPRAERYPYLPVDADRLVGELLPIPGLQPMRPFEAYIQRKLYLFNGIHALSAYLGHEKGYTYIHEAMADPEIKRLVKAACHALERAFLKAYPFDPDEYRREEQDILGRFADPHLNDPIRRVARDPLRKLRAEDRLAGAVHFLREQGEDATPFLKAIQAALHYRNPDDPASLKLAEWIAKVGEAAVLKELCRLT